MEIYIELGTIGETGTLVIMVDDNVIYEDTSAYYRDAININSGSSLNTMVIGANTSGTPVGNGRVWLDDLEIYTIDGLDNIPPEL